MKPLFITLLLLISSNLMAADSTFAYYMATRPENKIIFYANRQNLNAHDYDEPANACDKGDSRICIENKEILFTVPTRDQLKLKTFIPDTSIFIKNISLIRVNDKYSLLLELTTKSVPGYPVTFFYDTLSGLKYFTFEEKGEKFIYMGLGEKGYGSDMNEPERDIQTYKK